MCSLYQAPTTERMERWFEAHSPFGDYPLFVAPLQPGLIIRPDGAHVGQWGLIPWFSKTRKPTRSDGKPMSTNNCRTEGMATAPTFKTPWARSQRCLIPADSYDEPYWGTGKNIWWRFTRADGQPWALAGLWSEWLDPDTGELILSYTMLTQNCDVHPLLKHFHKPDPKLPPDKQDKRTVVPIERGDWEQWLNGDKNEAADLIRLPEASLLSHGAADPTKTIKLPMG